MQGYRCGEDKFEPIEVSVKDALPINPENPNYKRTLDNVDADGFKEFKIHLDLENFDQEIETYHLEATKDLFAEGMKKAVNTLKTLLKVKPLQYNWSFTDEKIRNIKIYKWDKLYIGDDINKGMVELDIDLFIFARFADKHELGELTLATAGARFLEPDTGRPLIGVVNINREVDYSKENSLQYFEGIILHEFTHVLGFSNNHFTKYFHNVFTKTDDLGIERTYINSSKVVQVGRNYFNCQTLEGVALEDYGGEGTAGSHWEARILLGDYMNGIVFTSEQVISEFTLALLEDSGYYKANYYTGGLMQFGKNKGCEFINKKCIEDGKLDPKFTNEFFYNIYGKFEYFDTSCSSDRQSRTYHIYFLHDSLPEIYQYYEDEPKYGGWESAEYCPVSTEDYNNEGENIYFVGHCSGIGSGEYGSHIHYSDTNRNETYKSNEIKGIIEESLSGNSFCVLSSLISTSKENSEHYSNTVRAVCYQMHCSERSLTIQINNDFIVCPRAGGKINALNYNGYLSCPDYNLICSGIVLCNDMFDCVEKRSLLRDDIIYDYETKTTQDLKVIKEESFSDDGYELSTNGKCPKDCSQCNELSQCIKCRNDYEFVEFTEDGSTKRECISKDETNDGYFKDGANSIYYKCIDNCKKCSNGSECITCKEGYFKLENNNNKCFLIIDKCNTYDNSGMCTNCAPGYVTFESGAICKIGINNCIEVDIDGNCVRCEEDYRLSNNNCYKKIENCQEYEEDDKCKKCENGYAFEENDRLNCKNIINEFGEYYSKDGGISYIKCDGNTEGNIQNCKNCEYNIDKLICNECKDDYILKDDENNICYLKSSFGNDKKYYYEDSLHIKTCSKTISKCEECEKIDSNIKCTKCENGYYFVNEDYYNCKGLDQITPSNEYFEENNEYYSCISYNTIQNCKICNSSNSCSSCQEGFAFISQSKDQCKNIVVDLQNKYYMDETDHTLYKKCSESIIQCITCLSKNECSFCEENYGLFNDKTKCIDINDHKYYKKTSDNLYYLCSGSINDCEECSEESKCTKCISDNYILTYDKCLLKIEHCSDYENDGKCKECTNGYKPNDNKDGCVIEMEHCTKVNNNGDCIECESDYRLSNNNICYQKIDNCQLYEENSGNCRQCNEGYAFEENDRLNCKDISLFEEYYSKDNKLSYFKCDGNNGESIQFCKKCNYNSELICNECQDNYILKDEENNICYSKTTFENDKKYYYEDLLHIKTCSKTINKCEECEKIDNNIKCTKCEDGYYFVDEDYYNCKSLGQITPIEEFYKESNQFYSCGNIKYNSIENCRNCNNKNSCSLCKDQYTFINNDKNICKKIEELENEYIQDLQDNTIYRKCSEYINNCKTCSSKNECLSCENNYGLFNDKTKCIDINNHKYYKKVSDNLYYLCSGSINNCEECSEESKCTKCISDNYILKYDKCLLKIEHCNDYENDGKCRECSRGYKVNDNKDGCMIEMEHCTKLNDDGDCIECENDYRLSNNNCYKKIEKCEEYEEDENCKKCENGYAFKENDRLNCKNIINEFEEYYSKDNGISYFKCDGSNNGENIQFCKKCNYNNELICNECQDNYVLKDDENNICYSKTTFENDKKYYYEDSLHIKTCSKRINKCEECEKNNDDIKCTKCENEYYFVDEDYYHCKSLEQITPINEFYLDNNEYYSCGNINYNSIENCKICNKNSCSLCKDQYTFINNDKNICRKIDELENEYIQDLQDNTIYRKCSEYINNCKTCSSKDECSSCENNYGLFNDKTKCIDINNHKYYKKISDDLYYLCSGSINNCEECSEESKCTKCISDNYILEYDKCLLKIEHCNNYENDGKCNGCTRGYKPNDNKDGCVIEMEHCTKLNDNGDCIECENDYRLSNNNCYKKIEKCQEYEVDEKCKRCENGYAFKENDRLNCKNTINEFGEYYSKDNGISYFKCDGNNGENIQFCKKCNYNNGLICNECQDNYVLKDDENNICYSKSTFGNDKKYYYEDSLHIKTCSKTINKCEECEKIENNIKCTKCEDGFYFVDEDYYNCKDLGEIIPEFYKENNQYYSCGNIKYNSIENCKECDNKNSCNLCKDGFTFIDDELSSCKNIEQLGNEYVVDSTNTKIYRKCNFYMENCNTCTSQNECTSCISSYGLYNDKKTCIDINEHNHFENPEDRLYYLCSTGIDNCEKCSANNECIKCKENYARKDNDKSTCHALNSINNEEYYQVSNDNNMYLKCSYFVQNCVKCDYPNGCTQCKSGFIFTNDDYTTCHEKSKISLSNYYTNDGTMYYSCDIPKYNNDISCFLLETKQNITLTFLQIQKINNKLYCYMMTHSPLPKRFQLKLTIDIYSSKKIKNLEESEKRVVNFIVNEDSDGTTNKIITFTSDTVLNEDEDIEKNALIEDVQFNNDDERTKSITDNNNCIIKFNKNSELADTGKVSSLIKSKKTVDLSNPRVDLISLSPDKVEGCEFSLISESPASFTNDDLELEMVSSEDGKDKVKAKCNTKDDDIKDIKCFMEDDVEGSYSFKDNVIPDSKNFISIDNSKKYKINCKNKNTNKIILIVAITICTCGLVGIMAAIIVIICKNRSYQDVNVKTVPTEKANKETIEDNKGKKMKSKKNEQKESEPEFLTIKKNKKKDKKMVKHNNQQKEQIKSTKRKLRIKKEE